MPGDDNQCSKVRNNEYRVLEHRVKRRHDAILHLYHITGHACYDVALALFREESQRQLHNLLIDQIADITGATGTNRDDARRRKEIRQRLQQRGDYQEDANKKKRGGGAFLGNKMIDVVVEVVRYYILHAAAAPLHEGCHLYPIARLKQYLQNRDDGGKGENV